MRQPEYSGQFKRDVKQTQKRGKDMGKLKDLLNLHIEESPLPASYLDHPLKGGGGVGIGRHTSNRTGF
ncbi:type II toxin-antitoxin system RelE/ParE family toxin [Acidithiobacillus ferrivorans]|uniref:type II toxin-antitoxin system RelE/ParE family toxin n=1 Tax=Acidithiobacillus ferrivorans TaxID=160808 RepID=UPI002954959E|nr:type II toxin-antitoxin system mRNA interferase toxin, RelE/StbE family [Acidithiobacillus ferrivorans]